MSSQKPNPVVIEGTLYIGTSFAFTVSPRAAGETIEGAIVNIIGSEYDPNDDSATPQPFTSSEAAIDIYDSEGNHLRTEDGWVLELPTINSALLVKGRAAFGAVITSSNGRKQPIPTMYVDCVKGPV